MDFKTRKTNYDKAIAKAQEEYDKAIAKANKQYDIETQLQKIEDKARGETNEKI